jgi:hypothetical protein
MTLLHDAIVIRPFAHPKAVSRALPTVLPLVSVEFRATFGGFERPSYAHGIYRAAQLAVVGILAIGMTGLGVAQMSRLVASGGFVVL